MSFDQSSVSRRHHSRGGPIAFALAFAVTGTALAAVLWIGVGHGRQASQTERLRLTEQVNQARTKLETALNGSLLLGQGLAVALAVHGRLTEAEFATTAASMAATHPEVRHMAIAYGTVVNQIYPRYGNEKALGLDFRRNDRQWPAVERAIQSGQTVVDGPIALIQGGQAVISRTPVFRPASPGGVAEYFALASVVIDFDSLTLDAGLNVPRSDLAFALRDANSTTPDRTFLGDDAVVGDDPIVTDVHFAGGHWRLYARPKDGWSSGWSRLSPTLTVVGLALVMLVGLVSFGAARIWRNQGRLLSSLRDNERRLGLLLDTAPVAMFAHRHGRLLYVNRESLRMMGAAGTDDLLNRPMLDFVHPDFRPMIQDRVASLRQPGDEIAPLRLKLLDLAGQVVDAEIAGAVVDLDGEPAVLAVASDISRSARAEAARQIVLDELQRSNDELRQFAFAASHDLQEPLRQIAAYVQMLERRYSPLLDQDGRDFIGFAVAGVKRMRRLIDDLYTYSQLQRAQTPFTRVSAAEIMDHVCADLADSLNRSGAQVEYDALPFVQGDAGQLRQLMGNLLDNAIRYSRTGVAPRVQVSAVRQGPRWLFSFVDNGIGIAPEYHASIFDVFKRLHGAGQMDGTGFGLAICRRIVERHGGRIWVDSTPGAGSTFLFTLTSA